MNLRRWTLSRRLVAVGFLMLLALSALGAVPVLRGTTAATRLFDLVPFVDPLALVESLLAARTATGTALVGAGLVVLVALLLGPVFCGWLCPLGLVLDLNHAVRARVVGRRRTTNRPGSSPGVPSRSHARVRLAVLGVSLGLAVTLGVPLFQVVSPIHAVSRGVALGIAGIGLALPAAILALEWLFPRLWCRALCPLGALHALLGRAAPLRVRIDPELAGQSPCAQCTIHCPMGIRVMEDWTMAGKASVDDPSCTRCGSCLDACPRGVLHLGLQTPRLPTLGPLGGTEPAQSPPLSPPAPARTVTSRLRGFRRV